MTPERWHHVTEIFHAARACAPERRGAFVAEACLDDADLRREVETMLAGHDAAGQFGETPLFGSLPLVELSPSALVTRAQAAPFQGMTLAPGSHLGPVRNRRRARSRRDGGSLPGARHAPQSGCRD